MNYWNKVAHIYNFTRLEEREAYEQMYAHIRTAIQGKEVLELATGTGIIAFHTAEAAHSYLATDYAEEMLRVANNDKQFNRLRAKGANLRFEQADATCLPYEDGQFDVVLIANALHIMPDPDAAISEIKRVLRPDGMLIAPTYIHGENTLRQRLKARLMALTGFREYAHWTEAAYHDYLQSHGLTIAHHVLLPASFPLAYTECRKT